MKRFFTLSAIFMIAATALFILSTVPGEASVQEIYSPLVLEYNISLKELHEMYQRQQTVYNDDGAIVWEWLNPFDMDKHLVSVMYREDGTRYEVFATEVVALSPEMTMELAILTRNLCCAQPAFSATTRHYHEVRSTPPPRTCIGLRIVTTFSCHNCRAVNVATSNVAGCGVNRC